MLNKLSERLLWLFLDMRIISEDNKEIYLYGIRQALRSLVNLLTTVIIGGLFGMIWESLLFMFLYIPLRSYAGGYHARTPIKCFFFSIVMMSIVLWVIGYWEYLKLICACQSIVALILIFFLAPIEDVNKPLDEIEIDVYRRRARRIALLECSGSLIANYFEIEIITRSVTVVLCMSAIMLLMGKLNNIVILRDSIRGIVNDRKM